MAPRQLFWIISLAVLGAIGALSLLYPNILWLYAFFGPLFLVGLADMLQSKHAIRRNFPVVGHGRYLLEKVRPEIQQYFIESDTSGTPFDRELRSLAYQRAKQVIDTVPFGTQNDVYAPGFEWIEHSLRAKEAPHEPPRVTIGGKQCKRPYEAALLNISAMSYGSLSSRAIEALNRGAAIGGFAHNTGEGGISPYHRAGDGDLIWQLGTGYFGARAEDGGFDPDKFREAAANKQVKMIEIKLSQGAKPGHGGILPAGKVTPEISQIRGVPMGKDVLSPPYHKEFDTPRGLLEFVQRLRELSDGKPIGFKLCLGRRREFLAICKAMLETEILPDFIAVDGAEGGTGAAPLEFSDSMGMPLTEALIFVHNVLTGCGLRAEIKVIASGKIISGFHMARVIALGADLCYSARGMMFSLGCIQARRCNTNDCPAGVATQRPDLVQGLVVTDKAQRTANFQKHTVHAFSELLAAAGMDHPEELRPWHIHRRISLTETSSYWECYDWLPEKSLLKDPIPEKYAFEWAAATADSF